MTLPVLKMRNHIARVRLGLLAALALSSPALAQTAGPAQLTAAPAKKAALAPARDLNGVWTAPAPDARLNPTAPLTPWGKEQLATHKNDQAYSVAASNDPLK